jgi:hypothetical protein
MYKLNSDFINIIILLLSYFISFETLVYFLPFIISSMIRKKFDSFYKNVEYALNVT